MLKPCLLWHTGRRSMRRGPSENSSARESARWSARSPRAPGRLALPVGMTFHPSRRAAPVAVAAPVTVCDTGGSRIRPGGDRSSTAGRHGLHWWKSDPSAAAPGAGVAHACMDPRGPPVPSPEDRNCRRHEQCPHQEGIHEDPDRKADPDVADLVAPRAATAGDGQDPEGAGEHETGGGDRRPRCADRSGDRVPEGMVVRLLP